MRRSETRPVPPLPRRPSRHIYPGWRRWSAGLAWLAPLSALADTPEAPPPMDMDEVDLEMLLDIPIRKGGAGSFGFGLNDFGFKPYLHAYGTFDAVAQQGEVATFDMHYFNVFVGADLEGKVIPEIQLEHEHGSEIEIRYAQIDIRLADGVFVRAGQFLVPFGQYNEYLYPEYLAKLPRNPMVLTMRHVVPVAWNDVGVQLHSQVGPDDGRGLDLALYVTNGLEQADDPTTPEVESGGALRDMRGNFVEAHHPGKAVGGRLNLRPAASVDVGASVYTGVYTVDGAHRLTLFGTHASWERRRLNLFAEGAWVLQEVDGGRIEKGGIYARAAFKALDWLEPAAAVDAVTLGDADSDRRLGLVAAVNTYPLWETAPTLILRVAGGHYINGGTDVADDIVMGQLTLGF